MAETSDRKTGTMEKIGRRASCVSSRGLLGVCVLAMTLALAATASARTIELHNYANSFNGGDAVGVGSPAFSSELQKLDVDNSSNAVLIATNDNRIYRFTAAGGSQPFSALTPNTIITGQPFGSYGDLEIDNSGTSTQGRFYAFSEASLVQAYEPSGAKSSSAQLSGDYCGAAVGPDGNFWTSVYQQGFFEHTPQLVPTGKKVSQKPPTHQNMCDMDMDTRGFFYIHTPYQAGPVFKFAPNGEEIGQIDPGPSTSVAIDRSNDDVYVDDGNKINHYNSVGQLIESFGTASGPYTGMSGSQGIGVNANSHSVYVTNNSSPRAVDRFTTTAVGSYVVPDAITNPPTAVTRISATMNGAVNADGVETNSCKFEWGPTYAYANAPVACNEGNVFTGSSNNPVTAPLAGLTQATEYHYRLVVENVNGKKTVGRDQTFSTVGAVKDVLTKPATNVARNTATLNGSFDGEGIASTSYYFEYGPTTAYGTKVPLPAPPGDEVGAVGVYEASQGVSGLTVEKTYHYRIVAENTFGKTTGNDVTFTTLPAVAGLSTDPATNINTETADLNASFEGDGLDVEYYFEWGATTAYGIKTPVGELTAPSGPTTIPPVTITDLQPLHTYHYRIVATNSAGTTRGGDRSVTTVSAPSIVTLSTSHVTATTADLHTVINPHGADTEYRFEYGHSVEYGSSVPEPDGLIAAGESSVPEEFHLTGLDGGVYHFRVVASSKYGVTKSVDQTFNFYPPVCANASVRQQSGSNSLPDCRAYELVTPEDQGITIIYPSAVPFSPTATTPSKLAFVGSYGLIPDSGEPINNLGDTYVATRTATGWRTKYVGLPSSKTTLAGSPPWQPNTGYLGSAEPDKWAMNTLSNQSLSALVDWDNGVFSIGELFEELHPGASNAPYVWDTTSGKLIDRWPTNLGSIPGGERFLGTTATSADLSHFVFTSNIPFAVGGQPGDMYDNETGPGTVKIASLREGGEHIAGTFPLKLSTDGSHILMGVGTGIYAPPYNGAGELYMRVNNAVTYEIAPGKSLQFLEMTPDGKKVYFTSEESLVPEDEDNSRDLYLWSEESPSPDHLTLVSIGIESGVGNSDACSAFWTSGCGVVPITFKEYTRMQGGLGGSPYSDNYVAPATGEIYFLSPELLHGSNGLANAENLYVYREGKVQFVTALDPTALSTVATENASATSENAVARMEISADGEHMAFLTASNVTSYDSNGHSEMYEYTPATGELICVSCLPSGEPPEYDVIASHNGRFMTEDGRVFFETKDELVPQDTNEAGDVYEYVEGRPQLITSGTNVGNNVFSLATLMALPGLVGVSADGTDVYFATYDALVGQDRNGEAIKIYDARSGGGFQFIPPVPPCVAADECHGPSSEAPASAPNGTGSDLGGSGNLQSSTTSGKKAGKKAKKARHKRHHKKKTHAKKGRR